MQITSDIFTSVTLLRYAAGGYDSHGRPVAGTETSVSITAAVQPGGMKELMSLEEGDRTKDTIAVWSQDPIYTLDEVQGRKADRISWDGSYWQVRKVESYGTTPELKHYHAIAVREQMT